MRKILPAEEMRQVDRLTTEKYNIPSLLLMENAARAAARVIAERLGGSLKGKSVLILCGKGNNGGDGAALARILWVEGADVTIHLFGKVEDASGDARTNFEICRSLAARDKHSGEATLGFTESHTSGSVGYFTTESFFRNRHHCVVDALLGTGVTRKLEGDLEKLAEHVSHLSSMPEIGRAYFPAKPLVVSLDLPSGLNADQGQTIGQNAAADLTVTFTAPKPANVLPPASTFGGELVVADIGSPQELINSSPSQLFLAEEEDAKGWLKETKFSSSSYKNSRGRALIVAGSKKMAGAAVLAANAAMTSGLGLVRVATPESARDAVASRTAPETLIAGVEETAEGAISHDALETVLELTSKADVVAVGSGLGSDEETTRRFVREFVERRKFPVLLDADGLNALSPFDLKGSDEHPLVLTPHIGEMKRLIGAGDETDLSDRVKIVREFARKHHVILILKGERNLIGAPDGRVVVSPTGNSGLGKAGAGDTLAGIITAFMAQAVGVKIDLFESVVAALYVAGLAGDIAAEKFGKRAMTATDVRGCLAEAFSRLGDE